MCLWYKWSTWICSLSAVVCSVSRLHRKQGWEFVLLLVTRPLHCRQNDWISVITTQGVLIYMWLILHLACQVFSFCGPPAPPNGLSWLWWSMVTGKISTHRWLKTGPVESRSNEEDEASNTGQKKVQQQDTSTRSTSASNSPQPSSKTGTWTWKVHLWMENTTMCSYMLDLTSKRWTTLEHVGMLFPMTMFLPESVWFVGFEGDKWSLIWNNTDIEDINCNLKYLLLCTVIVTLRTREKPE